MFNLFKKSVVSLDRLAEIGNFVRYGSSAGQVVSPETAFGVASVFCAVKVISEGIAQMPVRVLQEKYDVDQNLVRKIDFSHWAHRLLSVQPNEFQTPFEFREYVITAALLDRGFLGVLNRVGGEVREILPLPMGTWTLEKEANSWGYYFQVSYANGETGRFSPDQVLYVRGPSLDGLKAFSSLQAAREAIGIARSLEKQQANLSKNGGKPSGVLSLEGELKSETRDRLKSSWEETYGPDGPGGIALLDRGADFKPITMTGVDSQFLQNRQFQIEEIARAFRVHPMMLMHSNNTTTFASAEQHSRHHIIHTLMPWSNRFEQACNRDILKNDPLRRVDLDERALLRGDFKDQAEYYTKALGSGGQPGWMTVNEIRGERDMNPIQDKWANTVPKGAMMPTDEANNGT